MTEKDYEISGPEEGPELGSQWKLMFDGLFNYTRHAIGDVLMNLNGGYTPFTVRVCVDCTNNIVEYKVCILGIEAVIDLRIKILKVYRDSNLVIYQIKGE